MKRWAVPVFLALAYVAGGLSPARADNADGILRQLERISDSLRELAHREIRVVCECRNAT